MRIRTRRGWEIPEHQVTPEWAYLNRRTLLAGAGAAIIAQSAIAPAARAADADAQAAPRNPKYVAGRALTTEQDATTYNNYYEFSEGKNLWRAAKGLTLRPWTVTFDGMVKQKRTIGVDDLFKQVTLEERVYRHRCVEAWAMTVPWTGFPLSKLVAIAEPLGSAKYVVFESAQLPDQMPGLRQSLYPWPYIEAVTIDEAANDMAFISTGIYGKALPPQNGAPLRLTLPWKYGFKSGKAIVRVTFTDKRPTTFWEAILPDEYGFWANVNPAVSHPRWSQARERLLGSDERVPTQIYNGYGEFVASMYDSRKNEKLFM
jgi:sulfoxide reductase catalytic subunit YedY